MQANAILPIIIPAKTVMLLCFLPPALTRDAMRERVTVMTLAHQLRQRLPDSVRVLNVDESMHPDVVQSFSISQLPAFLLIRKGIELWRQEGIHTFEELLPGLLESIGPA